MLDHRAWISLYHNRGGRGPVEAEWIAAQVAGRIEPGIAAERLNPKM